MPVRWPLFKKKMILSTFVLLPLIGLWFSQTVVMRKGDIAAYQKMTKEKKIASSSAPAPTNQQRKSVQKDIWFSQDPSFRLHYKIRSERSLLTLIPVENRFEVVENLEGIKCFMQDKLLYTSDTEKPMQQFRYFEAEDGIYRFSTQEFKANDVTISLFRTPGHNLPNKPIEEEDAYLHGVAHDISFFFGGKTPQFQAKEFNATMVKE